MQDWLCVKCAGVAKLRVLADGRLRPLCEKHGAGLSIVTKRSSLSGRPTEILAQFSRESTVKFDYVELERAMDGKPIFDAPDGSAAPPKVGRWVRRKDDGRLFLIISPRLAIHGDWPCGSHTGVSHYLPASTLEPALPRKGEWWRSMTCQVHRPGPAGVGEAAFCVEMGNVQFEKNRAEQAACGCLVPVNFGLGDA